MDEDETTGAEVALFFTRRHSAYRRRGIGTHIAHEVWKQFPGLWEVRVMESNVAARDFWVHAISIFVGEPTQPARVEKDGKFWALFLFESKRVVRVMQKKAAQTAGSFAFAPSKDGGKSPKARGRMLS